MPAAASPHVGQLGRPVSSPTVEHAPQPPAGATGVTVAAAGNGNAAISGSNRVGVERAMALR